MINNQTSNRVAELLAWGDDLSQRYKIVIKRMELLSQKHQAKAAGLKLLNDTYDKKEKEKVEKRRLLAGVFADFMTRDNRPSTESIVAIMNRRGR